MQRDYWYSSMRAPQDLATPEAVGRYAAERALARLNGRKIATTECPVLFESPLAAGLLGAYVQATSGGALYRKTTFLNDSLGKRCWPSTSTSWKTRILINGKGSSPFDDEGVRTVRRKVLRAGKVQGYFPVHLLGAQAGHAHHRQRGWFAQPHADQPPDAARRRPATPCSRSWAAACS
jgi:PmbA protein